MNFVDVVRLQFPIQIVGVLALQINSFPFLPVSFV